MAITINPKIIKIIDSCVTYKQIQSCFNIVKNNMHDLEYAYAILAKVQEKMYNMRINDLKEHILKLQEINNKYNG